MPKTDELRIKASGPTARDVRVFLGDKDVTAALRITKIEWRTEANDISTAVLTLNWPKVDVVGKVEMVDEDGRRIERAILPDGTVLVRGNPPVFPALTEEQKEEIKVALQLWPGGVLEVGPEPEVLSRGWMVVRYADGQEVRRFFFSDGTYRDEPIDNQT